jgi:acetyl esterase/lipase
MLKRVFVSVLLCAGGSQFAFADILHVSDKVSQCLATQKPATAEEEFSLFYKLQVRAPSVMQNVTRLYYGKKLDQYGDLRLPPGPGPFPVAVVVHGGAWVAVANSDYMAPVADLLTKAGIATWNIEYSRIGTGGGWPGSFTSVGMAADYLRELAKIYPLDLNRVITVGHSSGGHYALWLAGRRNVRSSSDIYMPNPLAIRGVLSLDGTPDIEAFGNLPRGRKIIPQLLGDGPTSEIADRMKDASPLALLPLKAKQIFITEQSDRLPSMLDYIVKAQSMGDTVKYDVICPGNHFTTTDTENIEVKEKIRAFALELLH